MIRRPVHSINCLAGYPWCQVPYWVQTALQQNVNWQKFSQNLKAGTFEIKVQPVDPLISDKLLTNYVVPESKGSSPCLQGQATGPYPEPTESTSAHSANLPKIHSDLILPSTSQSAKWSLSFQLSHKNLVCSSILLHACHMPHPPHSP
jgi:hypothetical protein